jgi:hypothetical protein
MLVCEAITFQPSSNFWTFIVLYIKYKDEELLFLTTAMGISRTDLSTISRTLFRFFGSLRVSQTQLRSIFRRFSVIAG